MINYVVIIPALNPTNSLLDYVKRLIDKGFSQIIVVNDGSDQAFLSIFSELNKLERCTVLTHEQNKGKGRALKTAFTHVLKYYQNFSGIITADADGQHAIYDVYKVAQMLQPNPKSLILGVRDFNQAGIPKKSIFGNTCTSLIFQLLFKKKLKDTQTGLRGIPIDELPWMLCLKGERYEYEMNMLIQAVKRKINIMEVNIQTIYLNNNSGSYYNTISDSLRILRRIISGFFRKGKQSEVYLVKNHDK